MNIDPGNNQFFVETNLPTRISQGLHVNLLEDNMLMNANMYIYIESYFICQLWTRVICPVDGRFFGGIQPDTTAVKLGRSPTIYT